MAILEIREVDVEYQRRKRTLRAVVAASLDVERGEIVGLVGETGCGKSSLARVAAGLFAPTRGMVAFEGRPLEPLTHRSRPADARRLQMVFQNPFSSLNPRRRIGAQVADGLPPGLGEREVRRRVGEVLEQVGLAANAQGRYPHEYSGGQRQRIAIARALAASPSAIVLDEPLSSLDASAQAQVANLLRSLASELSMAILLISHDRSIVRTVADRVAVMYLGRVVEIAPTAALWAKPLHPYTEALIGAIPVPDGSGVMPKALAGEIPDPAAPPAGCRFHPRCVHAFEPCPADDPLLKPVEPGRQVACWLRADGAGEGGRTRLA